MSNYPNLSLFVSINKHNISKHFPHSEESCGVLLKDGTFVIYPNFADEPAKQFTFTPSVWQWIEEKQDFIACIFHSHCSEFQEAKLSYEDICLARTVGIDICVYHTVFDKWDYYSPNIPHPYPLELTPDSLPYSYDWFVGWDYEPGRADCYTLVIDYYKAVCQVDIEYPKLSTNDFGIYRPDNWNRFLMEFISAGWQLKLKPPSDGNVVLLCIGSAYPNHVGILACDGTKLLHSMGGKRKSELIPLNEQLVFGYFERR